MNRVARCAFSGFFPRYLFITRTICMALSPLGTQASRSLFGMLSNSSCTRNPSAKPAAQPKQVASRAVRAASRLLSPSAPPSLLTLEQTSRNSRPDRLISACSGVLLGEVLAGKPTKKIPSSPAISSKRTAASHPSRDSTSDSQRRHRRKTAGCPLRSSRVGILTFCLASSLPTCQLLPMSSTPFFSFTYAQCIRTNPQLPHFKYLMFYLTNDL